MSDSANRHLFLVSDRRRDLADVELIAGVAHQEEWAQALLWERYAPVVRRIMCRGIGPGHDVDDLIQEAFLRLFRTLPAVRDAASLRSFVITVATRVLQTELRARWIKRWLRLSDDGQVPERGATAADLEAREALARFYRLLDRLSPKHRTTFTLRYIEGLELEEVAGAVGISLATVKRWLPRIARRLHSQAAGDPLLTQYLTPQAFRVVPS